MRERNVIMTAILACILTISFTACGKKSPVAPVPSATPSIEPTSNPGPNPTSAPVNPKPTPSASHPPSEPGDGTGDLPHPPPPDPQQPQTDKDFWELMQRFGFMETKTKETLLADIKKAVATKITDWSAGQEKDKNKNIANSYKAAKKYMNPYPETLDKYLKNSFSLANSPASKVDFYLDVYYGPKAGRGAIVLQKVVPNTLEVLYFNNKGLITNYTQTKKTPKDPAPLLRLTHYMFIPPSVYSGESGVRTNFFPGNW